MKQRVIIIGAGIGGLATANLLAKAGYDVSVYEKNAHPGGRAGRFEAQGFTFDTGPSWYLMPEVFEHYFALFGKSASTELGLVRLSPAYKVFFEHAEPITITSNLEADAATFEAIEPNAGARLRDYALKGEEIYQLSLRYFLYTNFSSLSDILNRQVVVHVRTMLSLALTPLHSYVARFVRDIRLQQILEYPMVFLGSSPFAAPAVYSLMGALDFKQGVYYPKGGLYTIIERLIALGEELGVRYHYGTPVTKIIVSGRSASGVTLLGGQTASAELIVSNADLHFTETQLLDKPYRSYAESYWAAKKAGPSALLLYLGVEGTLPHLEHHNLLFVNDWKGNFDSIFTRKTIPEPASLYVCRPSATDPNVAPAGYENLFVLVPLPPGVQIDNNRRDELAERYLSQIETTLAIPDLKSRIVYRKFFGPNDFLSEFNAWQNTALGLSHTLPQSAFFRTKNKSKKVSNLYYVGGSTVPGIGLPMCLISAELLYKRLAGDTRGGPVDAIRTIGADTA